MCPPGAALDFQEKNTDNITGCTLWQDCTFRTSLKKHKEKGAGNDNAACVKSKNTAGRI
jgi:hypothetical protein